MNSSGSSKNLPVRVLFLCTGNSCRSQMAEGWARSLKRGKIEAYSAGVVKKGVDPAAVSVMAEAGVDISSQKSKTVFEIIDREFDYVVTMCSDAQGSCPVFPGKAEIVHRGFDDPPSVSAESGSESAGLEIYRRVRDEIRDFVAGMPENLENMNKEDNHV